MHCFSCNNIPWSCQQLPWFMAKAFLWILQYGGGGGMTNRPHCSVMMIASSLLLLLPLYLVLENQFAHDRRSHFQLETLAFMSDDTLSEISSGGCARFDSRTFDSGQLTLGQLTPDIWLQDNWLQTQLPINPGVKYPESIVLESNVRSQMSGSHYSAPYSSIGQALTALEGLRDWEKNLGSFWTPSASTCT